MSLLDLLVDGCFTGVLVVDTSERLHTGVGLVHNGKLSANLQYESHASMKHSPDTFVAKYGGLEL